jgi:hypothetical protein
MRSIGLAFKFLGIVLFSIGEWATGEPRDDFTDRMDPDTGYRAPAPEKMKRS